MLKGPITYLLKHHNHIIPFMIPWMYKYMFCYFLKVYDVLHSINLNLHWAILTLPKLVWGALSFLFGINTVFECFGSNTILFMRIVRSYRFQDLWAYWTGYFEFWLKSMDINMFQKVIFIYTSIIAAQTFQNFFRNSLFHGFLLKLEFKKKK